MNPYLRAASAADLPSVERLLLDAGLVTAGVAGHIDHFLLADAGGRIVASAGLERYGRQALLRSVAVAPDHRGRGLGRRLVLSILERAAGQQVQEIYLFTTSAAGYFRRFGFVPIAREEVAEAVRASEEYGECRARAQAMMLRMGTPPAEADRTGAGQAAEDVKEAT